MMSLLVSSRNAGNLKLFWFQVHRELLRKTTKNPKFALSSFTQDTKLLKRMAYRNEKRMFYALEELALLCKTFYRRHLQTKFYRKEFVCLFALSTSFKKRCTLEARN